MIKYFQQYNKNMAKIKIKPEKVTKKFLSVLPERSYDVIVRRYGLGEKPARVTLESIGKDYGITRERVRQIENNAIKNIKKSNVFNAETAIFEELKCLIDDLGGIATEEDILNHIGKDDHIKNHIHFLLVLGDQFNKEKEDRKFKSRWYVDSDVADIVHDVLEKLTDEISDDNLYPEEEIISLFVDKAGNLHAKYKNNPEMVKRWLAISKIVDKNHFNEWGLANSSNINAKGIRDYAYLSIRQHGSPMHFREVAKSIENNFDRKAHVATCHNELIKDPRFVLVGRGLYALSEWGYASGIVRDVIINLLKKEGPLTKEDIIDKVLRERYIKENTVVVNLQNPKYFKRDNKGKYSIV
ncbi:TPA: hypothetical protein DCZ46_02955 [Candidatus Campbellbacteria bacterium]|jgi:hypothetical protein|uniref:RNA polymerase sigma-70 region 4 domain-containing protein n=2 Tax=Candidatus Campbelliibacteriota TaxID=1752727 RepID=A0A1F5EPS3_9BACT|nr:MAG: RNA polymerase sigma factor [Candidatus Campbellbacteria bacterium GW2011_GWD2_35_24]KKP75800.1 MAG: hypothetical protein UR75_C0002G0181 [Candidatus Campbellbacteria bacterium GW2011_GWC2_35_28]KKP76952.1 MAG: RNA polymerase sigma factor [Candidatus Campbellbacteria bacterium GW2011_GWC1_35_31]KKP78878.1 MAG: RNA polymerase sigma factor [Candidatus Campbellbacteria bacterium GW2011_GWD1_35_49]OGD68855.1 MAG: hypothetical protein A2811_00045 [Candidatus Campbellbacteria bacterium RIFCSP